MLTDHSVINIKGYLNAYLKFGHSSLRKLVCTKPGSRQPTVRAGSPEEYQNNPSLCKKSKVRYYPQSLVHNIHFQRNK